jgi:hypothetical protein
MSSRFAARLSSLRTRLAVFGRAPSGLAGRLAAVGRSAGGLAGRAWGGWRAASWPIRTAIAGGAVLLALGVGLAGTWVVGSDADSRWSAGSPGNDYGPGPGSGDDRPKPGRADDPGQGAQAGSAVTPPAFVQDFAQQPGTNPNGPAASPTAGVQIAEGTDGCDHAYGGRDVCVPWEFPAGVTDKCGWLRERGFKPLKIEGGRDRHALDRNADGTACGAGD